ncbi:hypothetical protein BDV35DRAFT_367114 [Aspergillus flavus]|uniref:Uncharacterized protein n=1 Tax=Aspergillus flavus TaxID=5059 RepID=A0A5N6GJF3_ASPFL|nr:hypothetical protein BDV35DRAFT_367114 [Aspergillus flavus]
MSFVSCEFCLGDHPVALCPPMHYTQGFAAGVSFLYIMYYTLYIHCSGSLRMRCNNSSSSSSSSNQPRRARSVRR